MTETTQTQVKKYSAKKKMQEMIDDGTIFHFFIITELMAFSKGLFTGVGISVGLLFVFSLIFGG